MKTTLAIALSLCTGFTIHAHTSAKDPQKEPKVAPAPYVILENRGQVLNEDKNADAAIRYYCETGQAGVFFKDNQVSYILYKQGASPAEIKRERVDVEFENANAHPKLTVENVSPSRFNFYGPEDKYGSKENVHGYRKLTYTNLYPNIDLVYTVNGQSLKYDFVVHPGGDYRLIKMNVKGAQVIKASGKSAKLKATFGSIDEEIPHSYFLDKLGNSTPVEVTYACNGNQLAFKTATTRPDQTLVIDPTLTFFTNFSPATISGSGAAATSIGKSVKVNPSMDGFTIVGSTNSTVFPATVGPYTASSATSFGFITYFDASGTIVWSTYVQSNGATSYEDLHTEYRDILACGYAGPGLGSNGSSWGGSPGTTDGLISAFEYSTGALLNHVYIGGSGDDVITCISSDYGQSSSYFVGGYSTSLHLDGLNAYLPHPLIEEKAHNGGCVTSPCTDKDGFVLRFQYVYNGASNPISFVPYAYEFIGSGYDDEVTDLDFKLDANATADPNSGMNKLYLTGTTMGDISSFWPAIDPLKTLSPNSTSGDKDVFVMCIGDTGILWLGTYFLTYRNGTFLGDDATDEYNPRIDVSNDFPAIVPIGYDSNVYVSFTTSSTGLSSLTTVGAPGNALSGSGYDNFGIVLNYNMQSRKYASYLKPATTDPLSGARLPFGVKVDERGDVYFFGTTASSSFGPTIDITPGGKTAPGTPASNQIDAFLIKLNPNFSQNYTTLIGTTVNDYANEIALDLCGTNIYMTGASYTAGAGNAVYAYKCKIDNTTPLVLTSSAGTNLPSTLSFTNPMGFFTYSKINWYLDGQLIQNPAGGSSMSFFATLPGTYTVEVAGGDFDNQCSYKSNTITLAVNCGQAPSYTNLNTYLTAQAPSTNLTVPAGNYYLNSVITIPDNSILTIQNALIVAAPCSRIDIAAKGKLTILNSVLTSCTNWEGIYRAITNTTTSVNIVSITNSGISNARIGFYGDYTNSAAGVNVLAFNGAMFNNNVTHVGLACTTGMPVVAGTIQNSSFLKRMSTFANCTTNVYTNYNTKIGPFLGGVSYDSYIYLKGLNATGLDIMASNQFTGETGKSSVGVRGSSVSGVEIAQNNYTGEFYRCISIDQASAVNIHDEMMKCTSTANGIYLNGSGDNNVVKNCHLEMSAYPASKVAGISMYNCGIGNIEGNYIYNYTNGAEFFFDNNTASYSTVANMQAYIQKNSIYNAFSGVVVSYKADPYNNSSGINSGYTHKIPVWVKCNGLHFCQNGILGSGKLIDQYKKIPPTGTSTVDEADPGNYFQNSVNWDVIWGNGGASGYTYFSDPTTTPNSSMVLTKTAVSIDGTNRGATPLTNDFTLQTQYTGTVTNISAASCYGLYSPSTGVATVDPNRPSGAPKMLNVYPNPTHGSFTIPLDGFTTSNRIEVIDILGKTVYSGNIGHDETELHINGSDWQMGMYIIRLYENNHVIGTAKLIKTN